MKTARTNPALIVPVLAAILSLLPPRRAEADPHGGRPNVVLIITDDQGYGDLGFHGNPLLRTPNLDAMAAESVRLTRFRVSPVCSPTRASLMTGRYNYRTGVVDTYIGRSMMRSDEVTLAEMLRDAGYETGIFGKWHLGDNAPMRPSDQGFSRSLVHNGGGIGQPSDPPGNMYHNPVLREDNRTRRFEGYCSDIFTDAAIAFMKSAKDRPFFAYVSYNAPHTPLQSPPDLYEEYRDAAMTTDMFPDTGHPLDGKFDADVTAHIYAMVESIDDNMGRLLGALRDEGLEERTIVVFLTDNGPQQPRYNGGLRGRKGSVYEGGIRVPCLIRRPGYLSAGMNVDTAAAHIDLAPTLLDLCGIPAPPAVRFDGISLRPLLEKGDAETDRLERTLYFQWHRGDAPELYRAFAACGPRWKLVQARGVHDREWDGNAVFELFDLSADPYELTNLADAHPDIVTEMKLGYKEWFREVGAERGYDPPRIRVGSPGENPSTLTRQDWRGPRAGWGERDLGHWEIEVATAGLYNVRLRFAESVSGGAVRLRIGMETYEAVMDTGKARHVFVDVPVAADATRIHGEVDLPGSGDPAGAHYIDIERIP